MSYFGDAGFGIASATENTSTPLSGGGTWTGTGELNNFPDAMITAQTDVAGTITVSFSSDGVNYDDTVVYNVIAGAHKFRVPVKGPRKIKVSYVNGAAAQSVFRLHTFYGTFRLESAPLNTSYELDSDAILTRSSWTWLDITRGLAAGVSSVKKFGRNESVGTTYEPVSVGGIYRTPQAAAATTVRIKSGGNANDTAAGSGAREVTIEGLDENFEVAIEAVATAGASASSSTTTTFTRIYRAYVSASGTYATALAGSHAATIVVENTAGTEDWADIDATNFPSSQTEIAAFSIPAGATGFVKLRNVTVDSGNKIDLIFFSRTNIDQTAAPYDAMRAQAILSGISGGGIEVFGDVAVPFGPYVGPTDVGFLAKAASGTAKVSVEFEIFIIDE